MSLQRTTLVTATVVTTAAGIFVSRSDGKDPRDEMRDALLAFGALILAGCLLDGVKQPDSIGRGLLWGAGGLAAAYGIDKGLAKAAAR